MCWVCSVLESSISGCSSGRCSFSWQGHPLEFQDCCHFGPHLPPPFFGTQKSSVFSVSISSTAGHLKLISRVSLAKSACQWISLPCLEVLHTVTCLFA